MTLSIARLLALKQQAGSRSTPAVPSAPVSPSPNNQIETLRRMVELRSRATKTASKPHRDRSVPGSEIAPGLHLHEALVPMDLRSGRELCGAFDRGDAIDLESVLFFDTETTGLSGGTGTRAFMIGVAQFVPNDSGRYDLRVRQLLTTTLGAESAMLREFAQWLQPQTVLCSYNGKSYDAPLLKTRFRLGRLGNPLQDLRHVDLLYPTRRQYKGVYENCRLGTIEREVLRVVREDDLPGSEAPAAWLSYLHGGSAANLRRVGEHNHQDVVSLSRLLLHLSALSSTMHGQALTDGLA